MRSANHTQAQDPIDSVIRRLPAATPQPKFARAALLVLLFLISFLSVSAVQREYLPPPDKYEFAPKLAYLRERPGEFNLVYLGASTVFRQFVPEVFDARLAELGHDIHSFNLGTPGLTSFEFDRALRELAAADLGLDYVLLEPNQYALPLFGFRHPTERQVYSHDAVVTAKIIALAMTGTALPWPDRLAALADHLTCSAWHVANFGQGPRLARHLFEAHGSVIEPAWGGRRAGYQPLEDDPDPAVQRRHERLLEHPTEFIEQRQKLKQKRRTGPRLGTTQPWFYAQQIEQVRAMGARPLLVISASILAQPAMWALADLPGFPPMLDYNNPKRFPSYYSPAQRFDKNHLTQRAAERLSRRLANDFAKLLADGQL